MGDTSSKGERQTAIAISRPSGNSAATLLYAVTVFSVGSVSTKVVDHGVVVCTHEHFHTVVVIGYGQIGVVNTKSREQSNRCTFVYGTVSRTTNHRCLINTGYRYRAGQIQTRIGVIAAVGGAAAVFKAGQRYHAVVSGTGISTVVLIAQAI